MSKPPKKKQRRKKRKKPISWRVRLRRLSWAFLFGVIALPLLWVTLYAFVNPPTTFYQMSEARRVGALRRDWVPIERINPVMAYSAIAAEDVNFCRHWGLDLAAIQAAIEEGSNRGASTITQQVVKNAFLWHGRSYLRKVLEAGLTLVVEAIWSKQRIMEVYLNVAEFDEGVFGVEAAGRWYFGRSARDLTPAQAAQLAAVLPNPKGRSARDSTSRSRAIEDGAIVVRRDGLAHCLHLE